MPKEGIFAKELKGSPLNPGMRISSRQDQSKAL